jgi:Ca2+-binding EF-hand superfamily protein
MVPRRMLLWAALPAVALPPFALGQDKNTQKEKNLALGEAEAKRMLLLMDKDQNGKVSKQEFMSFMEAEFERLDINKDGELDVKELTQSQVRIRGAISR